MVSSQERALILAQPSPPHHTHDIVPGSVQRSKVALIGVLYGVTTWMFEGEEVKGPGSARCACMMM